MPVDGSVNLESPLGASKCVNVYLHNALCKDYFKKKKKKVILGEACPAENNTQCKLHTVCNCKH